MYYELGAIMLVILAALLMKLGLFGYILSSIIIAFPIIINLFSKASDRKSIIVYERKDHYFLRCIRSTRFFDYLVRVIIGIAYSIAIPPMLYLCSFADIASLLILIPLALALSRFIKRHTSYRLNYASVRTASTRNVVLCAIEISLYPIIWMIVTSKGIFSSFRFGVLEDLDYSLIAYAIGSFVDLINNIVDILSGFRLLVVFIPLLVGGGILFTGLFSFFEFFTEAENKIKKAFSPLEKFNEEEVIVI